MKGEYSLQPGQLLRRFLGVSDDAVSCQHCTAESVMNQLVWNICELILRGETEDTVTEICPFATLYSTNPTSTGPDWNPDLCCERPANNSATRGTALVGLPPPSNIRLYACLCGCKMLD